MDSMRERRAELRMMCADMVDVCWKDRYGKTRRGTALLEDISSSGACLQLEMPVPRGAEIRWHAERHQFSGRVCYCFYRETGYFAGVELDAGSRWSRQAYEPAHLLDPRTLAAQAPKDGGA